MTRALLLLATLPLAGCMLDRDKSDAEREAEMRVVHAIRAGEVVMAEPVDVVPECTGDEFRVHRCVGGRIVPW
jgi:hypothetical protein